MDRTRTAILLLEWTESFGGPIPMWVERLVEGNEPNELLRFLAGTSPNGASSARESDEVLVEALAGLPSDGELAHHFDEAAVELLRRAGQQDGDVSEDALSREALYRLLRAVAHVPQVLPLTAAAVRRLVASGAHLTLPTTAAQDVAGEALHVVAVSQTDAHFIPLWWRLCDLQSPIPEHAPIGVLGLRWSPLSEGDVATLMVEALSRLAEACERATRELLISERRGRTIFLSGARSTMRARNDLDWDRIGRAVLESTTGVARTWAARAFGLEALPAPVSVTSRRQYEDPEGANRLARDIRMQAPTAVSAAQAFLEHQRREAQRRGDALPLTQSLCNFASAITPHDPALAIQWAREAANWQPHNHYTAVTWAEGLVAAGRLVEAADVLLSRLHRLAEHAPMWVEVGKTLEESGELIAGREVLAEAVERFPRATPAWSALAEYEVRSNRYEEAIAAFESGLRVDPYNRYLLPGYARALALANRRDEAITALERAKATLGAQHNVVVRRLQEIRSGNIEVRPRRSTAGLARADLSADALGVLALLFQRVERRLARTRSDSSDAETARAATVSELQRRHNSSLTAAAALALANGGKPSHLAASSVQELIRLRRTRSAVQGSEFNRDTFESLVFNDERSGATDQRMVPLRDLSRLRAFATLVDGEVLREEGSKAISSLRQARSASTTSMHATVTFAALTVGERRSAWAGTVLETLHVNDETVATDALRDELQERTDQLDALEEDVAIALLT